MTIRVIIADDHALFREGLRALLKHQPEVTIVAETDRAGEIGAVLDDTPADILLLDLQMERSAMEDIGRHAERIAVVVVTASELTGDAIGAIRLGAHAVVFKRFAIATLMDAIRSAAAGDVWMPPSVQGELADRLRNPALSPLSAREEEVVRYVALGMRNAEVAKHLCISEQTVKSHLNNIFEKLAVQDRVELTVYAIRTGIIALHERSGSPR
jgi:two-component system NarL family response regulator